MSEEDPKPSRVESTRAASKREGTRTVRVKATGGYSLPSGASFLLQPGETIEVGDRDAQYLIDNDLAEK